MGLKSSGSIYSYPGPTATGWHVSDLLHNVLGPVVHCLVDLDSCSWLGVKDEPVNSSRGFAAGECVSESVSVYEYMYMYKNAK